MENGLTIIIAAYNTANYIEETLNSIQNQIWCKTNNNYEILVGIDGCNKTLEKMKEIMHNYKNINIYNMQTNMGTFVTANTLLQLAKYNKILRFDSDDIFVDNNSITKIMEIADKYDIVRYWYKEFYQNNTYTNRNFCAYGSILYDKKVFEIAGGFQNWKCSGDYEFFERVKNTFSVYEIKNYIYLHRIRPDSLMHAKETSMTSDYRKKLNSIVRNYRFKKGDNIFIQPIKNNYIKIN